jgi:hypothetical protein
MPKSQISTQKKKEPTKTRNCDFSRGAHRGLPESGSPVFTEAGILQLKIEPRKTRKARKKIVGAGPRACPHPLKLKYPPGSPVLTGAEQLKLKGM